KRTDNIGYVDKNNAFIRLHDSGMVVLGEDHTQTIMGDITQATGTRRFRHEVFTGAADQDDNPRLDAAMAGRKAEMHARYGTEGSERSHEGESFLPKMARGVAGVLVAPGYVD